jgi:hypothetical protein
MLGTVQTLLAGTNTSEPRRFLACAQSGIGIRGLFRLVVPGYNSSSQVHAFASCTTHSGVLMGHETIMDVI